jgi:hypothetical protein
MRALGMLSTLLEHRAGLTAEQIRTLCEISTSGAAVLLDLGVSVGIVRRDDDLYIPTRVAYFLQNDQMTEVNIDFVQDVCYQGMTELPAAIKTGRLAGLKALGSDHATIYEALAHLPDDVRKSWFAFDHFYSDASFSVVARKVLSHKPARLMDIGGNTGRFTRCCLGFDDEVAITIVDLPGQLADARRNLEAEGLSARVTLYEHDLLSPEQGLPLGADAVWMSQFLDCFSEEEVCHILKKARVAVNPGGQV